MADEFTKAALYGIKTFNRKVKEKIGIEKLIELLNEYCVGAFVYDNDILRFRLGGRAKIEGNAILISKSFGFIKWLVENEKIEYRKIIEKEIEVGFKLVRIKDYPNKIMEEDVEELLMLLAIQDEPISFLLSVLK